MSTIEQAADEFLQWKRINKGRSERTVEVYGLALRRLGEFLAGADWRAATPDELVVFTGKWLWDRGLKDPLARKTHVSAVREFYKWAAMTGRVKSSIAEAVTHPKIGRRLPRVMTLAHAESLMWAPDFNTFEGVRDATMMALLMGLGLRVSGLVGLNESNLIPAAAGHGAKRLSLRTHEKGGKERQLPIPAQADLLLRIYLEHPELAKIDRSLPSGDRVLFVSTRNRSVPPHEYHGEARRLRRRGVLRMLQTYARKAGIPEEVAHPHAMRHMFGTELAEDDVPTVTAARLMGHTDPKNTAIYQELAMRKLTKVVDQSGPLAKMRTPLQGLLRDFQRG